VAVSSEHSVVTMADQ